MAGQLRTVQDSDMTCGHCGGFLETDEEIFYRMCEGCDIDLWEMRQAAREQAWLEDDRNWE